MYSKSVKNLFAILALLFFVSCATTSNTQSYISPSQMQETAQLVIKREQGFLYSGLSANININGQKVGSLAKGSTQSFYASTGRNFISVKAFGMPGESSISLNTKKGESYFFTISPRKETAWSGILGGIGSAIYLAVEADEKVGGGFSLRLTSSTEEKNSSPEDKETLLLKLKSLYDKELISKEVYEKQQLEILSK